jgi:uncharacterized membrane protein YeiH
VFLLLAALAVDPAWASPVAILLIFTLRAAALRWKIGLPRLSSRT